MNRFHGTIMNALPILGLVAALLTIGEETGSDGDGELRDLETRSGGEEE